MFTTERFFAGIWAFWFLSLMVMVLTMGVGPKIIGLPMGIALLFLFYWCIKCAYRSERFSDYASLRLCFTLSCAPLFAFIISLAITYKQAKLGGIESIAISSLPLVITGIAYALAYNRRGTDNSLHVHGQRVEVSESPRANSWLVGGIGAGLSSLLYPLMQAYNVPMSALVCVLVFLSLYLVFYHRINIASLRALKERERRERRHYTFMELEYIRAVRKASLLGRLFAVRPEL